MTNKRESRKIVAAIIGLGHSLGLSTVAEGIETKEQADMLLWLGSELGQGWHYGRPTPFHAVAAIVAEPRGMTAHIARLGEESTVSCLEAFPSHRLAQLQAIYDGAPVGLCFLDCSLRYISMNQKLAEMNGAAVAKHLGNTVQEMVPELYPHIEPYLMRALKGEAISGVEVVRPRPGTGDFGWILISYQPAFDEAGEVIGLSVSVVDVTEQKQARDELQEIEFLHRQLVELNRQVPWMMDSEGNNLHIRSGRITKDSGPAKQNCNPEWVDALHPDDAKPALRRIKKALRTGERIDMEYRVQGAAGEWRWMRSRGLARLGSDGEITRWYGSVEDIHEKRSADAAARKATAAMRALLKAVPVAIIIEEGKQRAFHLREGIHVERAENLGVSAGDTGYGEERFHIHDPLGAENTDDVFQELTGKAATSPLTSEVRSRKNGTAPLVGLEVVRDPDHASTERQRLITMLEEFAEQRIAS